ncbi:MAG: hypothetical protein LDL53_11330 [Candidatus Hydrogenedens sp.]|nr:hypothetical protein [Candidatus Hydrogenedens sp.]
MIYYQQIAQQWDRLNALSPEDAKLLNQSIEDGAFEGFSQFSNQLMNDLTNSFPIVKNFSYNDINQIKIGFMHAVYSGYLIFVAYQLIANIKRPLLQRGIKYDPTLMTEYNNIIVPPQPNSKNVVFFRLLDDQPAIELLFEKVTSIELNILKKNYLGFGELSSNIGFKIRDLIARGVFMGYGLGYAEHSLRA